MDNQQLLYSYEDSRRLLGGIGKTIWHELLRAGKFKPIKIGGRRFIPAAQLVDFVANQDAANDAPVTQ